MTAINAIAKVRFSSARPQRVHLEDGEGLVSELLCMESGQQMAMTDPSTMLYVILGSAAIRTDDSQSNLETGHLLATTGPFTLTNAGEHRLVCLLFKAAS